MSQLQRVKSVLGRLSETPLYLDASGKPGLNYLCAGYQRYFAIYRHILKQWLICWRTVVRQRHYAGAFDGGE